MKGVIFHLAEKVMTDAYGAEAWDHVVLSAGVDGAYTTLGNYPDSDLHGLVGSASEALGLAPAAIVRQIGEGSMPILADRYPELFDPHSSTVGFLLTLNDIIHPEVLKLYPGADVPSFVFSDVQDRSLVLHYMSQRRLCALAEGFIRGAARHYRETVVIDHANCMDRGAESCALHCTFAAA